MITQKEYGVLLSDLGELCGLVGEFDGARSESPHAVFQKCLGALRRQHEAAIKAHELLIHAMPPVSNT